jgi:hypothetical protein
MQILVKIGQVFYEWKGGTTKKTKTKTGNTVIKKQMVSFLDSGDNPISTLEPVDRSPRQLVWKSERCMKVHDQIRRSKRANKPAAFHRS